MVCALFAPVISFASQQTTASATAVATSSGSKLTVSADPRAVLLELNSGSSNNSGDVKASSEPSRSSASRSSNPYDSFAHVKDAKESSENIQPNPQFPNVDKDPRFKAEAPSTWYGTPISKGISSSIIFGLFGIMVGSIASVTSGQNKVMSWLKYGAAIGGAFGAITGLGKATSAKNKRHKQIYNETNGINLLGCAALGQTENMKKWAQFHKENAEENTSRIVSYNSYERKKTKDGNTALHCAAGNGHVETVKEILTHMPLTKVNKKQKPTKANGHNNKTAPQDNESMMVKSSLQALNINAHDSIFDDESQNNEVDCHRYPMSEVSHDEIDWQSDAISAAQYSTQLPHNHIDRQNVSKQTALHLALQGRYPALATLLLSRGANHLIQDGNGRKAETIIQENPALLSNYNLKELLSKRGIKGLFPNARPAIITPNPDKEDIVSVQIGINPTDK